MDNNEDNLNAAEYVLGILNADDRARFEQTLAHDPAAYEEVVYWENQLAEVGLKLAPTPPPSQVWKRIKLETGVREPRNLRRGLVACARRSWRTSATAASVAAVAFAVYVIATNPETATQTTPGATLVSAQGVQTTPRAAQKNEHQRASNIPRTGGGPNSAYQPNDQAIAWTSPSQSQNNAPQKAYIPPDFVGQLEDFASRVGWNVSGYSRRGALKVAATGEPYTQRWDPATLELWLLPTNAYEEPISLGLMPVDGSREISLPQHVASEFYTDYNRLAVSVEPPGGSDTGTPTGDILLITTLSRTAAR